MYFESQRQLLATLRTETRYWEALHQTDSTPNQQAPYNRKQQQRQRSRQDMQALRIVPGNSHILSGCPSTHALRIRRHDSIAKLLQTACEAANLRIIYEHHIRINNQQLHKPDLIVVSPTFATIIDVSIVTGRMRIHGNTINLRGNWYHKAQIYNNDAINQYVRNSGARSLSFSISKCYFQILHPRIDPRNITELQGYNVKQLQCYTVTRLHSCKVTGLQGNTVTGLHSYRVTQ